MAKVIFGSVGNRGINVGNDVMTVQFLLNCVPVEEGGPVDELKLDGIVGPLTIAAINRFQHAQLPRADGRVDPERFGGKTIVLLNEFDPSPDGPPIAPPFFPPNPSRNKGGKSGGKGKSGKRGSIPPGVFPDFPPFPPPRPRKKGGGKKGAGG